MISLDVKVYLSLRVRKGVKIGPVWLEPHVGCPAGLGKRFGNGPIGLEPHAGAIIRKKYPPPFI